MKTRLVTRAHAPLAGDGEGGRGGRGGPVRGHNNRGRKHLDASASRPKGGREKYISPSYATPVGLPVVGLGVGER